MMQHPAFKSPPRLFLFAGTCLLTGLAVIVSQIGLVSVSAGIRLLDGLITSLLFGFLSTLLWYVIHFAGLTGNNTLQKVINYTALIFLVNLVWIGADYFLLYVCVSNVDFSALVKTIPLKIILGILIYLLVVHLLSEIPPDEDQPEDETEGLKKPGIKEVYGNPVQAVKSPEKITVKVGQKIHVIAITDIYFIQAEGDYVKIQTASNHFIKEQTMKYFEENLPPEKFVRVHRSVIVNVDVISRIELYEKQFYRITLQSGYQLKASASGYKLLRRTLQL